MARYSLPIVSTAGFVLLIPSLVSCELWWATAVSIDTRGLMNHPAAVFLARLGLHWMKRGTSSSPIRIIIWYGDGIESPDVLSALPELVWPPMGVTGARPSKPD